MESPICRFFFRFILWLIPLQLAVWYLQGADQTRSLVLNSISWLAAKLYSLFGGALLLTDNLLLHFENGRFLIIDQSCTGLVMTATLLAGLLAFRCRKLSYMLLVLFVVQLLNQIRIVHLFYLIRDDMELFRFYHLYIWQGLNFLFACGFFTFILWREGRYVMR